MFIYKRPLLAVIVALAIPVALLLLDGVYGSGTI